MELNFEPSPEQTMALTACMLTVSQADGVHAGETALIRAFYEGGRTASMPSFADVQASATSADKALALLESVPASKAFAEALASLCLATGYADGALSDGERALAVRFTEAAGLPATGFASVLQEVRDSLLGSLAHLPDAQSVARLAKEL